MYFPLSAHPQSLGGLLAYLRETTAELVARYHDAGVGQVIVLQAAASVEELRASLERLARDVVEPARAL